MIIKIFTSKKILWLAAGCILVLAGMIFGTNKKTPEINTRINALTGNWRVTEITGEITSQLQGPAVKHLCDDFTKYVYNPVIGEEKSFIKLLYRKKAPHLKDIPMEVYDTLNVVKDEKGLFIFKFSFDNGFQSNKILEGYGEQYHKTELIKGLWSFEVGVWTKEGVRGESITGTKWGGKGNFGVVGKFINGNRIEGQWSFEETATLPGSKNCVTKSEGSGNWIAIRE